MVVSARWTSYCDSIPIVNRAISSLCPGRDNHPPATSLNGKHDFRHWSLRVFDALGRVVATILDANLPAGRHEAAWGGTTGGVYILRLQAGAFTASRVVTVL